MTEVTQQTQSPSIEKYQFPKSSGFRGVTLFRPTGKWRAQISANGKTTSLGDHDSENDAAKAFDRAAINKAGWYAKTNFPVEQYKDEVEYLQSITQKELVQFLRQKARKSTSQTSSYRGVSLLKQTNKWHAQINVAGKQVHLGFFNSEDQAARAYDRAAINKGLSENSKIVTNFDISLYVNEIEVLHCLSQDELLGALQNEIKRKSVMDMLATGDWQQAEQVFGRTLRLQVGSNYELLEMLDKSQFTRQDLKETNNGQQQDIDQFGENIRKENIGQKSNIKNQNIKRKNIFSPGGKRRRNQSKGQIDSLASQSKVFTSSRRQEEYDERSTTTDNDNDNDMDLDDVDVGDAPYTPVKQLKYEGQQFFNTPKSTSNIKRKNLHNSNKGLSGKARKYISKQQAKVQGPDPDYKPEPRPQRQAAKKFLQEVKELSDLSSFGTQTSQHLSEDEESPEKGKQVQTQLANPEASIMDLNAQQQAWDQVNQMQQQLFGSLGNVSNLVGQSGINNLLGNMNQQQQQQQSQPMPFNFSDPSLSMNMASMFNMGNNMPSNNDVQMQFTQQILQLLQQCYLQQSLNGMQFNPLLCMQNLVQMLQNPMLGQGDQFQQGLIDQALNPQLNEQQGGQPLLGNPTQKYDKAANDKEGINKSKSCSYNDSNNNEIDKTKENLVQNNTVNNSTLDKEDANTTALKSKLQHQKQQEAAVTGQGEQDDSQSKSQKEKVKGTQKSGDTKSLKENSKAKSNDKKSTDENKLQNNNQQDLAKSIASNNISNQFQETFINLFNSAPIQQQQFNFQNQQNMLQQYFQFFQVQMAMQQQQQQQQQQNQPFIPFQANLFQQSGQMLDQTMLSNMFQDNAVQQNQQIAEKMKELLSGLNTSSQVQVPAEEFNNQTLNNLLVPTNPTQQSSDTIMYLPQNGKLNGSSDNVKIQKSQQQQVRQSHKQKVGQDKGKDGQVAFVSKISRAEKSQKGKRRQNNKGGDKQNVKKQKLYMGRRNGAHANSGKDGAKDQQKGESEENSFNENGESQQVPQPQDSTQVQKSGPLQQYIDRISKLLDKKQEIEANVA